MHVNAVILIVLLTFIDVTDSFHSNYHSNRIIKVFSSLPNGSNANEVKLKSFNLLDRIKEIFTGSKIKNDIDTDNVDPLIPVVAAPPVVIPVKQVNTKIGIIGCGISGLACALELLELGTKDFVIIERDDDVGGRIRTDIVDGYQLDRGFQVFIEKYPESLASFDYDDLNLKSFWPGAIVRYNNNFHVVSDPIRRPQDLIDSAISPIGSLIDKIKVGIFAILVRATDVDDIFARTEYTTLEYLQQVRGLSPSMINRFFKPFYQGIFLSSINVQSSRMFEFVFKMFSDGAAMLPAKGMGAISQQLAARLPVESLKLNTNVQGVIRDTINDKYILDAVSLIDGKCTQYICDSIIVAADPIAAKRLIENIDKVDVDTNSSDKKKEFTIPTARGSTCVYFGIDSATPPVTDPVLILNGENDLDDSQRCQTRINNVCFPSQVSADYAPPGKSLASITLVGSIDENISDKTIEEDVRKQLVQWFGPLVLDWKFLKVYRIAYAQPAQNPPYKIGQGVKISKSLYCCGDHRSTATLNGALGAGKQAGRICYSDLFYSK